MKEETKDLILSVIIVLIFILFALGVSYIIAYVLPKNILELVKKALCIR